MSIVGACADEGSLRLELYPVAYGSARHLNLSVRARIRPLDKVGKPKEAALGQPVVDEYCSVW